jgi:hypothetical protein
MRANGAPVPSGLFESYDKTIATAATISGTLHLLVKGATVRLENLAVVTTLGASYLIMIVITLLTLMQRVKPKFGSKDKEEEEE